MLEEQYKDKQIWELKYLSTSDDEDNDSEESNEDNDDEEEEKGDKDVSI